LDLNLGPDHHDRLLPQTDVTFQSKDASLCMMCDCRYIVDMSELPFIFGQLTRLLGLGNPLSQNIRVSRIWRIVTTSRILLRIHECSQCEWRDPPNPAIPSFSIPGVLMSSNPSISHMISFYSPLSDYRSSFGRPRCPSKSGLLSAWLSTPHNNNNPFSYREYSPSFSASCTSPTVRTTHKSLLELGAL
jgi:hypothetical protein